MTANIADLRIIDGDVAIVEKPKTKRPHQAKTVQEAVELLAACTWIEYEGYREAIATEWKLRVSVLDRMVEKRRKELKPADSEKKRDGWKEVTPAAVPQDAGELLNDLITTIRKYIIMDPEAAGAAALWVCFAWTHDSHECSPILYITGPTMRCGKSHLLTVLSWLVPKPQGTMSFTGPTAFRFIEQEHPTLLVDEVEKLFERQPELIGIINSGFDNNDQSALRMEEVEKGKFEVRRFGVRCPKVLCGIGKTLPAATADRTIPINMRRKKPTEKVSRLRRRDCAGQFEALKARVCRWAKDNDDLLIDADPALPNALHDRAADCWEPLLAIADLAGGEWPARARNVAVILMGGDDEGDAESIGVRLLADLRTILGTDDAILTKVLLKRLEAMDERPWGEFGKTRKPITSHRLGALLHPFSIETTDVTVDGIRGRGYTTAICQDAFERYFPPIPSPTPPENDLQSSQARNTASTEDFSAVFKARSEPQVRALKSDEKCDEYSTSRACELQGANTEGAGEHKAPNGERDYNTDPLGADEFDVPAPLDPDDDEFPEIPPFLDRSNRP